MQIIENSNCSADIHSPQFRRSQKIKLSSACRVGGRRLAAAAVLSTLALAITGAVSAQSTAQPEAVHLSLTNTHLLNETSVPNSASAFSPIVPSPDAAMLQPVRMPIDTPPELSANPGRPAMATSALLTPVGYIQIENGLLYAAGSAQFSSRSGLEETARMTVASRLQFIVSAEPMAYSATSSGDVTQRGDVDGGLQVVVLPGAGSKPTIAVSYLRLVRGGNATDMDIGGYANSALLLASADYGHYHVDANGFLNETEGTVRRLQFGQAVALSHPLTAKLSGTAELRHFTEPLNRGDGCSALGALGYAVRPNLVFDTGVVRGFTDRSTHWQITGGFTYVLPGRLWGIPQHGPSNRQREP